MKNKKIFYHILLAYVLICSVLISFFCIKICIFNNVGLILLAVLLLIIQVFEILVYIFFFYKICVKTSLIISLMDLVVCMQFFFLVLDFIVEFVGNFHSPLLIQLLKIIFIIYLIYCRKIRIEEIKTSE